MNSTEENKSNTKFCKVNKEWKHNIVDMDIYSSSGIPNIYEFVSACDSKAFKDNRKN